MATLKAILNYLNDPESGHDQFGIINLVEVEQTGHKDNSYPGYTFVKIKGENHPRYYMRQTHEVFGHEYVWQTGDSFFDSYNGYLLYPYGNKGFYVMVEYSC